MSVLNVAQLASVVAPTQAAVEAVASTEPAAATSIFAHACGQEAIRSATVAATSWMD